MKTKLFASALSIAAMLLLAFAGVILFASASRANVISPGDTGQPPDNFTSLSGLSFVASDTSTTSNGNAAANFTEAVYRNSAGTLDFLFQVKNTSTSSGISFTAPLFTTETNTNFTGFSTDVGFITNGSTLPGSTTAAPSPFVDGASAPLSVDRTSNGSGVVFHFSGPVGGGTFFAIGLLTGATTDVLVIATNATNYDSNGTVQLDFTSGSPGPDPFEPAGTPTPLPATLPLFATGLGGLGLLGWRRKRKTQAG